MIRIENIKTYKGDGWPIHRPSPLGNPFKVDKKTSRAMAISQYREWLKSKLLTDNPTSRAFNIVLADYKKNGTTTLLCFCAPLQCHGEVIRDFIRAICDTQSGITSLGIDIKGGNLVREGDKNLGFIPEGV